ncbi:porin [Acidovorax carolinensis]|uniref:Porin n=1 Tax=Acidovorax carolinensis TaxID=553814 RepID=A0A240UAG6_9BURK|nr:porin [Acidovorax carolinensis]ART56019.1 porin [Acidovorax carolinensis]ART58065.1 porin [Acidovorax carolinensis]
MKKSLIALAVLAASGAAMAQSSVTLYGVADAGVTYLNGNDNWSGVTSGNNLTSRLGFRGTEDLGGGLKANFVLEGGFNLDNGDGASGYAGAKAGEGFQFKRRSTVGLAGSFGEVRLGRELTAAYNATARYDVFGSVGLAQSRLWADGGVVDANANAAAVTTNQRVSNMVTYVSPDFTGFKVGLNYGFGETTNGNSDSSYLGAGLMYDNGPLSLGLGLERLNEGANSVATSDIDAWSLGGSYDFGVAKLLAGYRTSKVDLAAGENKRNGAYVAVTAPVGPGLVRASYNRYENKLNGGKAKADQFGLGYVYSLSKRTSVYGTYAYLKNKDGASLYTLGSGGLKNNGSQQGVQVGVSHAF